MCILEDSDDHSGSGQQVRNKVKLVLVTAPTWHKQRQSLNEFLKYACGSLVLLAAHLFWRQLVRVCLVDA